MAERFFVMPGRDASLESEAPVARLALVIGNGAYPAGRLENPTADATLVADTLRSLGFEVQLLLNAGKAAMEHALVAFGQLVEQAGPRAITFVYFAGHGLQDEGRNYLLPIDAVIPERRFLRSGAIPVTFLVEELAGATPRANIIVLDACRHALLSQQTGTSTPDNLRGLASISNLPDATLVAYSTAANTVAKDGEGRNSPFALALAKRLVEPDLKIQDVFLLVARDVAETTGQQQRPAFYLQGGLPDIILTRPDDPAAEMKEQEGSRPNFVVSNGNGRSAVLAATPTTFAQPLRLPRFTGRIVGMTLFAVLAAVVGGFLWLRPQLPAPDPLPPGADRFGLTRSDWCCTRAPWLQVVRLGRWPQVERAAAEGDPAAMTLLAGAQLRGVEHEGRTVVRANIESARSLLFRAEHQHPQARLLLAGLLDRGGAGQRRDRERARQIYSAAASGNDADARGEANRALSALDAEARLQVHVEPLEFVREAPAASVQITVYLGFGCRGCGEFLREMLPQLRARYLDAPDRGPASENLRIVVRPYTRSKVEEDAATLIACADPRNRLAAAELLAQHETIWSVRDTTSTFSERDRMEMVLKLIGLGRPRSQRCLADAGMTARLARQSEEAHRLLAVASPPVVFVNGQRLQSPTVEALFAAIDEALPPDDQLSSWRR